MIDESEVLAFLKNYEIASAGRDFSRVAEMIHPDATYRFTDGDFVGREEIRAAFEKTWALSVTDQNDRFWLTDVKMIHANATSALVSYNFHWTGNGPSGSFQVEGRGTQLLVRSGEGLQSMYEHLSR